MNKLLLLSLALGACTTQPTGWEHASDSFHAEVLDQVFDVANDQIEIIARPATQPVTLRTAGVLRNRIGIDTQMLGSKLRGETTVDLARSSFVESLAIDDHGIAQSWQFANAAVDLVVTIDVGGAVGADRVVSGLLLHGVDDIDVFYGDAMWIDPTGKWVVVPAQFVDGEIVLAAPATTGSPGESQLIVHAISATQAFR